MPRLTFARARLGAAVTALAVVLASGGGGPDAQPPSPKEVARQARRLLGHVASLHRSGQASLALERARGALRTVQAILGEGHPAAAYVLQALGALHIMRREPSEAVRSFEQGLAILQRAPGDQARDIATLHFALGHAYQQKRDLRRAARAYGEALEVGERAWGPSSRQVTDYLWALAQLQFELAEYGRADALLRRGLDIWRRRGGPPEPRMATLLHDLGTTQIQMGHWSRGEQLLTQAVRLRSVLHGPQSLQVAESLKNLGVLYVQKGDPRAEAILHEALLIRQKELGPEHLLVADSMQPLGELRRLRGAYPDAFLFFSQALRIREKHLGLEHPFVGRTLRSLAALFADTGEDKRAERYLRRALRIIQASNGENHPLTARTLLDVAALRFRRGDMREAERLMQRALRVLRRTLGPEHPDVANVLVELAGVYEARQNPRRALKLLRQGIERWDRALPVLLSTGSEPQKRGYLEKLRKHVDVALAVRRRLKAAAPEATRLALTTVLRRKGRVLDALADVLQTLQRRADPGDRALLEELAGVRTRLATAVLAGADRTGDARVSQVAEFRQKAERLEAQLSARSAAFQALETPVTLERVQSALPADGALVEIVKFWPVERFRRGERRAVTHAEGWHYLAFVLRRTGDPAWVDLGQAKAQDDQVAKLRAALLRCARADAACTARDWAQSERRVRQMGQALERGLIAPLRRYLGDARHLLLSPDGSLHLLPFEVLVDAGGRYLLERFALTYLTSGRDLVRPPPAAGTLRSPPVVLAAPDYDDPGGAPVPAADASQAAGPGLAAQGPQVRSVDLRSLRFPALPGALAEARALKALLPGVRVLSGGEATEAAVKALRAPRILHLATHGFFLADQPPADLGPARGVRLKSQPPKSLPTSPPTPSHPTWENPLLRSGLALAGANQLRSGAEDGVLTALEASALDLWGTQLVVLSACETGLGEVQHGEGVYGLRRALVLAGAESLVMSLWSVEDTATRDLMVAFYRGLAQGLGRSEALRQARLALLTGGGPRRHPYFWAGFIPFGRWGPLDLGPAAPPEAAPPDAVPVAKPVLPAAPEPAPAEPRAKSSWEREDEARDRERRERIERRRARRSESARVEEEQDRRAAEERQRRMQRIWEDEERERAKAQGSR